MQTGTRTTRRLPCWAATEDGWSYAQTAMISQDERANDDCLSAAVQWASVQWQAERVIRTELRNEKIRSSQRLETANTAKHETIFHFRTLRNSKASFVHGVQKQTYSGSLVNILFSPDQSRKSWCLPPGYMFHLPATGAQMTANALILKTGTMCTLVVKPSLRPFLSILLRCFFLLHLGSTSSWRLPLVSRKPLCFLPSLPPLPQQGHCSDCISLGTKLLDSEMLMKTLQTADSVQMR